MIQQISNLFLKRKIYFDDKKTTKLLLSIDFFVRKLKIMNEYNELLFSPKQEMRTFNFVPRCTWVPLEMGFEFCFNSQTVLIFAVCC